MLTFHNLVKELRAHNKTNDKKEILGRYSECKDQLRYALDPFKMFNVTSKNLTIPENPSHTGKYVSWYEVVILLDRLHKREITGHAAIEACNELLVGGRPELIECFPLFLNKDLKCGTGDSLVNKVFKECVPDFKVQLCQKQEDPTVLPYKNTWGSRKLDGVRVEAINTDGEWKFLSRKGKRFTSLGVVEKELKKYFGGVKENFALASECCIVDEDGNEDFSAAVSQIKRKDYTIPNPMLKIFNMVELKEYLARYDKTSFVDRQKRVKEQIPQECDTFSVLEQIKITSGEQLSKLHDQATKDKWEGWILADGDAPYEGKRTKALKKLKKFYDDEFEIVGVQEGEADTNFQGMLGALLIKGVCSDKKNKDVEITAKVGSGFKQQFVRDPDTGEIDYSMPVEDGERVRLWKQRSNLIGQIVTVKYFEISKNKKDNSLSLRFPTFKYLHGEERTT